MNKENGLESLTDEQRARISQKFKAAKALLARKRPRLLNTSPSLCLPKDVAAAGVDARDSVPSKERVPLKELKISRDSPLLVRCFLSHSNKHDSTPTAQGSWMNEVHDKLIPRSANGLLEGDLSCSSISKSLDRPHAELYSHTSGGIFGSDLSCISIGMSVTELECSRGSDYSSPPSVLDDDFDDCILRQVDALCEDKSTKKLYMQRATTDNDMSGGCGKDSHREVESNAESVLTMNSKGVQDTLAHSLKEEDVSKLQDEEMLSLPQTCWKFIQSLNDDQREAACTDILTPLMVVAGPGSGKTSTMVGRILVLLKEGIDPARILAMTFTTAAVSEMRDRITREVGKDKAKELTISTFHSFSLQLCRTHAEKLSRTSDFLIYGHGQQRRAVIEAVRVLENGNQKHSLDTNKSVGSSNAITSLENARNMSKKWQKFVTQAKASGRTPDECREKGDDVGAMILSNYNDILSYCNALDYHDLISGSVKLLTVYPEVLKECQELWKAIIIDEFQDTSAMQYSLLRLLGSRGCITVVGDEDQSIFSFNGADTSGFDSFRKDFPNLKEIRLKRNYRSTRCIVEAASSLIQNNKRRCQLKKVVTDNSSGAKITVKECHNENAQCSFVIDKILEATADDSEIRMSFGNVAILYRRQVTGKVFQAAFRSRRIPFNVHGVSFYRKKVIKAILAMLKTTIPGCDDGSYRQVFKTLLPFEKEERKKMIEYVDKLSTIRKCSFVSAAEDIFNAKISGTFKRSQLSHGRKVLLTLGMIMKLVQREQSLSAVVTSIGNMIPQRYLLEQRAVLDIEGGKLLNEDNDLRSVLEFLLDDVTDFLTTKFVPIEQGKVNSFGNNGCGCVHALKAFVDYISTRERENFHRRRKDNEDSVTLTTIHQSKGLEWDIVFIVKVNESEIPLLHEHNGIMKGSGSSVEEERRLLYVGMTRAQKKLYMLHVLMDSNWQMLQPSRFLKEIPCHLQDPQDDMNLELNRTPDKDQKEVSYVYSPKQKQCVDGRAPDDNQMEDGLLMAWDGEAYDGNSFLRRFGMDDRRVISHIFHHWGKKQAFKDPKRLLDKVGFVVDERLRMKKNKHKDVFRALRSSLNSEDALRFAEHILRWEQIAPDKRAHLMREKQEHFQKLRMETAMNSSTATPKQIAYLRSLGCTVVPESRLHASHLIEQYKSV
ncbi:hypothetical protein Dimus_007595 [Dionaea muscipula]